MLPAAFPYVVTMEARKVDRAIAVLRSYEYTPSSFAVTSEYAPTNLTLWMSQTSFDRLVQHTDLRPSLVGMVPNEHWVKRTQE